MGGDTMLMNTEYQFHWEVVPMDESIEPTLIFTEEDSVAAAAQKYEELYGNYVAIKYIRKYAVTIKYPESIELEDETKIYQQK